MSNGLTSYVYPFNNQQSKTFNVLLSNVKPGVTSSIKHEA